MQNFFEVALLALCGQQIHPCHQLFHAHWRILRHLDLFLVSAARPPRVLMAKRSIVVAASLGLLASVFTVFNGDESAYEIAQVQPMKLAAFEGLYEGQENADLVALGIINREKKVYDTQEPFIGFNLHIPGLLSLMANRSFGSFVPGMKDLVYGNAEHNILGSVQKMDRGKKAVASLDAYKQAKKAGDTAAADVHLAAFNEYKEFLGYGYLANRKRQCRRWRFPLTPSTSW
jgi:cytochrome bd ubiquinol oxidase subunit I